MPNSFTIYTGKTDAPATRRTKPVFALDIPNNPVPIISPSGKNQSTALKGRVVLPWLGSLTSYWLGSGDMIFEVAWSAAGRGSAWIYKRQPSLHSLAVANGIDEFIQITNATSEKFYMVTDSENLSIGDIVVIQNTNGYYLSIKLEAALYRQRNGDDRNEVTFSYLIAPAKSTSFASVK